MDIDAHDYLMAPEMDHELARSASDQSIGSEKSHHRITNGYEICTHTCVAGGCISRKTNTALWYKEGHSVRRHAANRNMHASCGGGKFKDCPGRRLLGKKVSSAGGRDATDEEVSYYMGMTFSTPDPGEQEVDVGVDNGDSSMMADRLFKLIYIPDAAMRILSKEKALNDLGFMPTMLSESEYEHLQHLTGSIHMVSKCKYKNTNAMGFKVIMQEWVSIFV